MTRRILTCLLVVVTSIVAAPVAAAGAGGVCSGIPTTGSGLTASPYEQAVVPVTFAGTTTVVEFVERDDAIYALLRIDGELRDSQGRVLHVVADTPLYGGSAVPVTVLTDPESGELLLTFGEGVIRPQSWFIRVQPAPLSLDATGGGRNSGLIRAISASLGSGSTNATVTLLNLLCSG